MLYTVKEVQKLLRLSDTAVWKLMDEGQLPYVQFNPRGRRLISQEAIDDLILRSTKGERE